MAPAAEPPVLAALGAGSCSATDACPVEAGALEATTWPQHYQPIRRIAFTSIDELLEEMKPQAETGTPLVIQGTDVIQADKWADMNYLLGLLKETKCLVKRSPNHKFRYFDVKKNIGKFDFKAPVQETQQTLADFTAEAMQLLEEGRPERLYLQETLSGHAEMAQEFASWGWELLIRVSSACGWGLPDSNELFVGMRDAETPLHFDERENLFFQVKGRKEIVTFPFVDYLRLYPFPTSHACDRQSMVGSPRTPDLEAFPRFRDVVGHYATLEAGDLLYLPYGWWHWLRNLDHLAVSVSFWSTTPPSDLSKGVPSTFTPHMLTRVRRNLESMIAQQHGPENHNQSMLNLREAVLQGKKQDPYLDQVRALLTAVRMTPEEQDKFLLDTIEGRFGIDWNRHVEG